MRGGTACVVVLPRLFYTPHALGAVLSAFHAAYGYSYRLSVVRPSTGLLDALMRV